MKQNVTVPSNFLHLAQCVGSVSLAQRVRDFSEKKQSISDYIQTVFSYIESTNHLLNAVVYVNVEQALDRARELDARKPLPHETLYGVPILIKENIQKVGFPVECGSKILKGYRGQFDATVVSRLERAGAIIIGSTNMDEFAMGSSNETSAHGPVRNPLDLGRVPGGSSGGAAAAQSMGYAPLCLGSDTGGSVRQPAAYCGVYGLKPTYGTLSRYGLVAFGSSLDQISPFARDPHDLDLLLTACAGPDASDATSQLGQGYVAHPPLTSLSGVRVGVPRSLLTSSIDSDVLLAFQALEKAMKAAGAQVIDVEIPGLEHTLSTYYVIACSEASSNLARFDGMRYGARSADAEDLADLYARSRAEGFGDEVKLRIMLGTFALSAGYYNAYYGKAQEIRRLMTKGYEEVFQKVDFVYLPTAPTRAFELGSRTDDPVRMYLNDVFTIPANLVGVPALSVPAPVTPGTLPIGLQFYAPKNHDARLVALARWCHDNGLTRCTPVV